MSAKYQDFFDIPSKSQEELAPAQISNDSFFDLPSPIKEEKPSFLQEAGRHIARSASRIGESVLGAPGDVASIVNKVGKGAVEKITGKEVPEFDMASKIFGAILPFGGLKTSGELRQETKKLGGEFLEPQSSKEQFSDDVVSDFATLALPIKGKVPFLNTLGKALAVSGISNIAAKGAETLGFGESAQTATKLGTMFLASAFNPNGAKKYGDDLYSQARKLVPEGATVGASKLSKDIRNLRDQLKKGGTAPYKAPSLTKLNEIQSKIKHGQIPVDELTEFKIDLNKARSSLYLEQNLDKGGKTLAKRNLDATSKVVDDALTEYGKTNPAWEKAYRPANEVYGAIEQSKIVSNAVGKFVKAHPTHSSVALAAELFFLPKTIPAVATGVGLVKTGELLARIAKSPTLRKYYMGVVESALKEDSVAIAENLNKLDASLKKETPE